MATLPIGFFMPLPLPIMIPFMMWQSAAIAAGFGTYFQYAKRKVSAMSNDEFNHFNPSQGVNELFDDILGNIPSSFERIRSLNTLILQSMADFLEDGIRFLSGKLGGQLNQPFQFEGPPTTDLPDVKLPSAPSFGFGLPQVPQAFGDTGTVTPFVPDALPEREGPPAPPLTQQQLLDKYANWETYRQKGGLLTESRWRVARRGKPGGIPNITLPNAPKQGKIIHPAYFQQLKRLQNEIAALLVVIEQIDVGRIKLVKKWNQARAQAARGGGSNKLLASMTKSLQQMDAEQVRIRKVITKIQLEQRNFINKFQPR